MKSFVIILGVILLVLGVIGLVHPNFNYHQQEEVAKLGPIKALLVAGIGLVVLGPRMKQ